MRLLVQRVKRASVVVEQREVGFIGPGLLVFIGLGANDDATVFPKMIDKLLNLRIFDDEAGKPNRSVLDVSGDLLLVSQFTLYADTRKGRRPSYTDALKPDLAAPLFELFVSEVKKAASINIQTGIFGAMMSVELVNDGPFTIWLDSSEHFIT
jgi:D-tyrosyl-tRNA(Tyr) deacylase